MILAFLRMSQCYKLCNIRNIKRSSFKRKRFLRLQSQAILSLNFVYIFKVTAVGAMKLNHQQAAINLKITWTKIMWTMNMIQNEHKLHLIQYKNFFFFSDFRILFHMELCKSFIRVRCESCLSHLYVYMAYGARRLTIL